MKNKYQMSREENVFWAKRNLVDSIWKEANIEGIAVTFPDTKEIFEGRTVSGMSVDATIAINNLKHGWQFILDNLDAPMDLSFVRQVNYLVGNGIMFRPGELRQTPVSIGGTSWQPAIPDDEQTKEMLRLIMAEEPGQERALHMFAALCRAQLFMDGNKRTAQLVANKMLIEDGAGILAISVEAKRNFEILLVDFYETGRADRLLEFVADRGLLGTREQKQVQTNKPCKRPDVERGPVL